MGEVDVRAAAGVDEANLEAVQHDPRERGAAVGGIAQYGDAGVCGARPQSLSATEAVNLGFPHRVRCGVEEGDVTATDGARSVRCVVRRRQLCRRRIRAIADKPEEDTRLARRGLPPQIVTGLRGARQHLGPGDVTTQTVDGMEVVAAATGEEPRIPGLVVAATGNARRFIDELEQPACLDVTHSGHPSQTQLGHAVEQGGAFHSQQPGRGGEVTLRPFECFPELLPVQVATGWLAGETR